MNTDKEKKFFDDVVIISSSENSSFDEKREKDTNAAEIELDALKSYYRLRLEWSDFIKLMIGLLVMSQIAVLIAIGSGGLNFWGHEKLTWFFYTETFCQIVGLAFIVVHFLFKEKQKNL